MFVELGFGALLALLLVLVFSAVRILREYEQINTDIQQVLDAQTDVWGIKVANVEIKHVALNESMIRAIAKNEVLSLRWHVVASSQGNEAFFK